MLAALLANRKTMIVSFTGSVCCQFLHFWYQYQQIGFASVYLSEVVSYNSQLVTLFGLRGVFAITYTTFVSQCIQ